MHGWIVVYRLPLGASDVERVKFRQRLIGATTTSWGGKYKHHRVGLLEGLPHRLVMPGVVLVRESDRQEVERFLEEWRAGLMLREVKLVEEDLSYLRPGPRGPPR